MRKIEMEEHKSCSPREAAYAGHSEEVLPVHLMLALTGDPQLRDFGIHPLCNDTRYATVVFRQCVELYGCLPYLDVPQIRHSNLQSHAIINDWGEQWPAFSRPGAGPPRSRIEPRLAVFS